MLFFIEGESLEKVLEFRFGSVVKFEKGLVIIEGEVFVLVEEIGD